MKYLHTLKVKQFTEYQTDLEIIDMRRCVLSDLPSFEGTHNKRPISS